MMEATTTCQCGVDCAKHAGEGECTCAEGCDCAECQTTETAEMGESAEPTVEPTETAETPAGDEMSE